MRNATVTQARGGEQPLIRVTGVNHGPSINRTVLALILRAFDVAGRDWQRIPAFMDPARIIGRWGVFGAGDFTANGPVKAGSGRRERRHWGCDQKSGLNYIPKGLAFLSRFVKLR